MAAAARLRLRLCLSSLPPSSHLLFPLFLSFSLAPPPPSLEAPLSVMPYPLPLKACSGRPSPPRLPLGRRAGREGGARGRRRLWRRRLPPAGRCSPVGRGRPRLCRHCPAVPRSPSKQRLAPQGGPVAAQQHPKSHRRLSRPPRTATVIAGPRGHNTHTPYTYIRRHKKGTAWHLSRSPPPPTTNSKKTQQHMAPLITHHTQQTHRTRTDPYQPRKRGEAALL